MGSGRARPLEQVINDALKMRGEADKHERTSNSAGDSNRRGRSKTARKAIRRRQQSLEMRWKGDEHDGVELCKLVRQ